MSRRAKRPLDKAALKKADDAFYARHPEMEVGGKREPIPADPNDPCAARLREEWLDDYVAHGGKLDNVALPPCKPGELATPCRVPGPLSQKEADIVFKKLAGNKQIPFDYPVNCCQSRAHIMAKMMEQMGIKSQKLFYYKGGMTALQAKKQKGGKAVTFPDENGVRRPVEWGYHVAPTVKVTQPDGSVVDMVMDPSLSEDGPVTVAEWTRLQGNPAGGYLKSHDSSVYYTSDQMEALFPASYPKKDPTLSAACQAVSQHKLVRDSRLEMERANAKGP